MSFVLDMAQGKGEAGLRQLLEQLSDADLDILEAALSEQQDSRSAKDGSTQLPLGKVLDRIHRVLDRS